MTEEQRAHCAEAWQRTKGLYGEFVPYVYMVDGRIYFFKNIARRAAYLYGKEIERMSARECYAELNNGKMIRKDIKVGFPWIYDGELYKGGNLFVDSDIKFYDQIIRNYETTYNN